MTLHHSDDFKDIERIGKELIREQQRKHQMETLARVAEDMRKKGASERSIQTALKGFYEFLKPAKNPPPPPASISPDLTKPTRPDSQPAPILSNESPGTRLSDLQTRPIHWLWEKHIPLGKITILDGDPGLGKSLLAIDIAARVSTGLPMPDGTPTKPGGVILIAPEDGAEDTIKPRLEAARGDPSRVILLNTIESLDSKRIEISDRPFSLSQDLDVLETAIYAANAVLVILDPLMAVLGHTIDSSSDQDIREVFTPLAQLAERTGCAILIIRHLSKGNSSNPLYRGAGSIGIIAAARIGLLVTPDPDDEDRRILATTKNNLSKTPGNLVYQVVENEHGIPSLHWLGKNHSPVASLLSSNSASLSAPRQDILRVLKNSPSPLGPQDVAELTGRNYERIRRTLSRMLKVGELASPIRGLYTTPGHPCLTRKANATDPSETTDPTDPIDLTDPTSTHNNFTNTLDPSETTDPIDSTDPTSTDVP